jgi:Kef-type K+ transport system membrane component KefB
MKPVFRALILLLVVVGAGVLVRQIPLAPTTGAPRGLVETGTSLGVLLLGAWLAGIVFASINLPRITGYIAFGVLVGPDVLGVVTRDQTPYLRLVNDLAIAIIALTAGGEIKLTFLRKFGASLVALCAAHAITIAVVVGAIAFFFQQPLGIADVDSTAAKLAITAIVVSIAVSGSPAVVIAVIGETNARSRFAQIAIASVVCLDLVVIMLFALAMALAGEPLAPYMDDATSERASLIPYLAQHIGGSIAVGAALGVVLAIYTHRVRASMPIFVVLSSLGIALGSEALGLEPLIVALIAGMLMRNIWPEETESLFETVEELSLPVYAAFFAFAAVKIELELLSTLWFGALLLVGARCASIYVGVTSAARFLPLDPRERRYAWTAFVSQAGVTLALAAIVQRTFGEAPFATTVYNLILAMIALEEIIGPILFRWGLTRAGELEGASARSGDEPTADDALRAPGPRGAP